VIKKKPGNLIAAWWNIIVCGAIVIGAAVFGATTNGFGFLVAVAGVGMEIVFIRVLREILKERRSAQEG
jgi:hypothetical protein